MPETYDQTMPSPAPSQSAASFLVVAARPDGRRAIQLRQAKDEKRLAEGMGREKLIVLKSYRLPDWATSEGGTLRLKDQAEISTQLAQLLSRGVPLTEALEVTGQSVSKKAKPIVDQIREQVSQGVSFSDACLSAGAFDEVTVAVLRAAERTGDLAGASEQLATNAKRRIQIIQKATTLMIYPAIVLAISLMVGLFMLTIVVPQVTDGLRSAMTDGALPWYTELLAGAGAFIRANPLPLLAGAAALAVAVFLGRALLMGGLLRAVRVLPVAKDVVLAAESARFFSVMSAMSRAGVPLADALGTAVGAIGHPVLGRELDEVRTNLIEGGLFRVLIEKVASLPIATRRLLIAAERAGDLDRAFDTLATDHTEAVDRQASRLLAVLEPLLIVMVFAVIGTMLLAIMFPMLTMTSSIG